MTDEELKALDDPEKREELRKHADHGLTEYELTVKERDTALARVKELEAQVEAADDCARLGGDRAGSPH